MRVTDLHVLFDHFAVAFVISGIILEFIRMSRQGDGTFGWDALRTGTVIMVLSILAGFVAEEKSVMDSATHPLASYHKVIGIIAAAVLIGGILLRTSSRDSFSSPRGAGVRGAYVTLLSLALILTSVTVYLGMSLVYEHGVNVRPYEKLIQSLPPTEQTPVPDSTQLPSSDSIKR